MDNADTHRITERLRTAYGSHRAGRDLHPTDSLISTILSQHTADRNSHAAFAALQERYPSWEAVAIAPADELAETVRAAGLANIKAHRIQAALAAVHDRFGSYDLAPLSALPWRDALAFLRSLPGVGPKTAACVLLFSCGQPVLPVDTHVHRLARRLGLIGVRDSAERAHDLLQDAVHEDDIYDFHVNLIRHGRAVCRAHEPRCDACVLHDLCRFRGDAA